MKCSKCNGEMVSGEAHIGGGAATLMTGGFSLANLSFKAPKWRDHVLQQTSDVFPAHYCDHCGAITVETPRRGLSTLEA
jgi:hypothetical protein